MPNSAFDDNAHLPDNVCSLVSDYCCPIPYMDQMIVVVTLLRAPAVFMTSAQMKATAGPTRKKGTLRNKKKGFNVDCKPQSLPDWW